MKTLAQKVAEAQVTIDNFEAVKAAELAKLKQDQELRKQVLEQFPEALSLSPHGYPAKWLVVLPDAATVGDAIQKCEMADPVSMSKRKGTHTSFLPTELVPEDVTDAKAISPYIVEVKGLAHNTEVFLKWYSYIGDTLVQMKCKILSQEIRRTYSAEQDGRHNLIYKDVRCTDTTGNFTRQVRWATGGYSGEYVNDFTLYF